LSEFKYLECRTDLTAEQRQRIFAGLERFSAAVSALRLAITGEVKEPHGINGRKVRSIKRQAAR
jgi:hypothetical protein